MVNREFATFFMFLPPKPAESALPVRPHYSSVGGGIVIRGSWYFGRPPCPRECDGRDGRDARRVGRSRRILPELQRNRPVTPRGAGVVALVRELDEVRSAERGGDATRVLGRSSVVEVACQDQRWNIAAHRGTRRRVSESGKPFLAIA